MNAILWCPACGHSDALSQGEPPDAELDSDAAATASIAAGPLIERMRAALALFEREQAASASSRECPACGAEVALFDPSDLV